MLLRLQSHFIPTHPHHRTCWWFSWGVLWPLQDFVELFLQSPGFPSHPEPVPACCLLPGTCLSKCSAVTSSSWILESRDSLGCGCVCVVARGCTCPSLSAVAQTGAAKELFFPVLGKSFLQMLHWERSGWMFKVSLG